MKVLISWCRAYVAKGLLCLQIFFFNAVAFAQTATSSLPGQREILQFMRPINGASQNTFDSSKGNGGKFAGLVRTLTLLRQKDPHRPEVLQHYLNMVKTLIPLQRPDGFWDASLRDSTHFQDSTHSGEKDVAGTALFTYGIAWGIRQGYFDKKQVLPVIARAWNALVQDTDLSDYERGCLLLAGSEVYQLAPPPVANLDESKVPAYEESDPLVLAGQPDGGRVTTVSQWEKVQRPYLYHVFEKNVYGRMPTRAVPVKVSVTAIDSLALGGLATRKELTLWFSPTDTAARLRVALYLPNKAHRPAPVFVGYSFGGNATLEGSSQWPLKEIITRGYGVASAWYWDIEPDRADGWQTGIRTSLSEELQIEPNEWSAIGAWAWGLNRIADYLETDRQVDRHRLIVIGHSRLGKTAIWAGTGDPRWAAVISNESGEGGAALSKRDYGETVAIINAKFPWWFVPAYKQYGSDVASLPFDQHQLLSLIAPRPLYVASAEGDKNSDPRGEFLSATRVTPVYHLYKKKGLETDSLPPLEHPVGESVRYHIRSGKHDITLYDWQQYMDFADRWLGQRK